MPQVDGVYDFNPAQAKGRAAAKQQGPVPQGDGDGGDDDPNKGDGTEISGYVTPDIGPFKCANCTHFQAPNRCDHPAVVADPEVNGQVDPEGCSNYFKSAGQGSADAASTMPAMPPAAMAGNQR